MFCANTGLYGATVRLLYPKIQNTIFLLTNIQVYNKLFYTVNIIPWLYLAFYNNTKNKQEAHGPWVAHLSDIATADMQMLCNIFPILSSQLMKRSSFKQFLILLKNIYGMPVNGAWSFEQTLNGGQLGFTIGTILAIFDLQVTPMLPTKFRVN